MSQFRLFAHGEAFDVDAFLASTTLAPDHVWRRGDQLSGGLGRYPTTGVDFVLGDGLVVPLSKQEGVAIAYLKAHRDELRALARSPGADTFILGLQLRKTFESNVCGFCVGPSAELMRHCLDVGCEPVYYVDLDRLPEPEVEGTEPDAAETGGGS